jgi:UDP-GlcNAc:undecaprenyl-phosphate GlcNAc-1-phosphate transferase
MALLSLLLLSASATLSTALLIHLFHPYARRYDFGDFGGSRHQHKGFIPVTGGLAIFLAFSIFWSVYAGLFTLLSGEILAITGLLTGMLIIHLTGIADDLFDINPLQKFAAAIAAASVYLATNTYLTQLHVPWIGTIVLGDYGGAAFTLMWIMGVINAVNLIDGIDGLAGGSSLIVLIALAAFAWQSGDMVTLSISLIMAAAILGFLWHNYPPASVFMGDGGSLLLGYLLAVLPLRVVAFSNGFVNFFVLISLLILPFTDTATAFLRRMLSGKHPFKPDKDHLHHRLISLGLNNKTTMWLLWTASLAGAIIAWIMHERDDFYVFVLFALVVAFIFIALQRLGYLEVRRKRFLPRWKFTGTHDFNRAPIILRRSLQRFFLVSLDISAVIVSLFTYLQLRFPGRPLYEQSSTGAFAIAELTIVLLCLYWLLMLYLFNRYNVNWDSSRLERAIALVFTTSVGMLLLGFLIFGISLFETDRLANLLLYWLTLTLALLIFRLSFISLQRRRKWLDFAPKNALVIGDLEAEQRLRQALAGRSNINLIVLGRVSPTPEPTALGTVADLPRLIHAKRIEEIIFAAELESYAQLLDIVSATEYLGVNYFVRPALYQQLTGKAHLSLMEEDIVRFLRQPQHWQKIVKRAMDISFSLLAIAVQLLPVLIYSLLCKFRDGHLWHREIVIGRFGKPFFILKWRREEEKHEAIDRLFFRLQLQKITFFFAILFNRLSLVGPQIQNWREVKKRIRQQAYYRRRFAMKPGLTGPAQTAAFYRRQRLMLEEELLLDNRYLEKHSLGQDMRYLLLSLSLVLHRLVEGKK